MVEACCIFVAICFTVSNLDICGINTLTTFQFFEIDPLGKRCRMFRMCLTLSALLLLTPLVVADCPVTDAAYSRFEVDGWSVIGAWRVELGKTSVFHVIECNTTNGYRMRDVEPDDFREVSEPTAERP